MFRFLTEELIIKFLKFGAVGATGVVVDFGFTYVSKEILKIQKYVANAIGFTIAATTNYFLNRWWTFHSNNPDIGIEYSRFLFISILGLGINTFVIWLLVSRYNRNFYLSKLFAIGVVTIWNFILNLIFTFA
ncbi:MAG: GtrA family protein [Bacteroidales bacterium]|nr:GtrA family protein [Bacteroidales bacterium]MBK7172798.1 GtrA family protein [Bacteroidales bacterium]